MNILLNGGNTSDKLLFLVSGRRHVDAPEEELFVELDRPAADELARRILAAYR